MVEPNVGVQIRMTRKKDLTAPGLLKEQLRFVLTGASEFTAAKTFSWQDFDTAIDGQYTRPGGRQLRTLNVTFAQYDYDFFMPRAERDRVWALIDDARLRGEEPVLPKPTIKMPLEIKAELEEIMDSGTPFILVAINPSSIPLTRAVTKRESRHFDMNATLRQVTVTEKAGEPDMLQFDMQFSEYRVPGEPTLERPKAKKKARGQTRAVVKIADLPAGRQSMNAIAIWHYGGGKWWRNISDANKWISKAGIGMFENIVANLERRPELAKKHKRIILPALPREGPADKDDKDDK